MDLRSNGLNVVYHRERETFSIEEKGRKEKDKRENEVTK